MVQGKDILGVGSDWCWLLLKKIRWESETGKDISYLGKDILENISWKRYPGKDILEKISWEAVTSAGCCWRRSVGNLRRVHWPVPSSNTLLHYVANQRCKRNCFKPILKCIKNIWLFMAYHLPHKVGAFHQGTLHSNHYNLKCWYSIPSSLPGKDWF